MACFAGEHSLELARLALAESCFDEATAQAQTALVLFRDVQDGVGESQALEILGNVCLRQGGYTAAIDHYQRALRIMEVHGGRLAHG